MIARVAADAALIEAIRRALAVSADPARAPQMQAYMKSEMPFLGIPAPARRTALRPIFGAAPLDEQAWRETVRSLWRAARYREERYAAVDLSGRYRAYLRRDNLDLIEELIVDGAWWDYVDELAIRRVGPILRNHTDAVTPIVRQWATDADRWKRRSAVICQIGAKTDTDRDLLTQCIEDNIDDADFFLRKGIGWALRDYTKTDPEWVRAFVDAHPGLSPLSRREALRRIS